MHEPNKERNRVLRHGVNDDKPRICDLSSIITQINNGIQEASFLAD